MHFGNLYFNKCSRWLHWSLVFWSTTLFATESDHTTIIGEYDPISNDNWFIFRWLFKFGQFHTLWIYAPIHCYMCAKTHKQIPRAMLCRGIYLIFFFRKKSSSWDLVSPFTILSYPREIGGGYWVVYLKTKKGKGTEWRPNNDFIIQMKWENAMKFYPSLRTDST